MRAYRGFRGGTMTRTVIELAAAMANATPPTFQEMCAAALRVSQRKRANLDAHFAGRPVVVNLEEELADEVLIATWCTHNGVTYDPVRSSSEWFRTLEHFEELEQQRATGAGDHH